ncbi:MAG: BON domain-containing protein [Planctomycetaceae bacterium]|nr:BON domain-containing protein [Planctomycetaceae bacterium]
MRLYLVPFIFAAVLVVSPALVLANTNQQAAERIAASLSERFPGYDIAVSYQGGKVQLAGEVASVDMVQTALEQVRRVPGVKVTEIDNGLRVKGGAVVQPVKPVVSPAKPEAVPVVKQEKPKSSIFSPKPAQSIANAPVPVPQQQVVVQAAVQQPVQMAPQPVQMAPVPHGQIHGGYVPGNGQQIVGGTPMHGAMPPMAPPQGAYHPEAYGPQGPMPGQYNCPNLPAYAWPSYAAYPNYAEVCYPRQYSPKAWPYIGPFYPYPQAPLGWRKVSMEWHDGWWWLDFDDSTPTGPISPIFRQPIRYTY